MGFSKSFALQIGWRLSIPKKIYELDERNPVLNVLPIEHVLGRLPVVPVGDHGTVQVPFRKGNDFPGACADTRKGSGDGSRVWYINSFAMSWSRDL